ncbi:hypothetical protein C8Q72DRAFT_819884 [Fomitopsis betulina]|nr:hypothetical protein C8Q72DRAFT_819884 [Fomitopsis betulina]
MEIDTDPPSGGANGVQLPRDVGPNLAPFDKSKNADVILRSSDLYDFRARKAILAEASSVFDDMFSLPQPPAPASATTSDQSESTVVDSGEYKDGLPVIALQEESSVLNRLLRFCYPIPKRAIHNIDTLSPVLAASIKYAMDGVTAMLREELRRLATEYPLRAFCLAVLHGFVPEAKHAAKASLNIRRRKLYSSFSSAPELKRVDGKTAFLLLDYHQRCYDAVAHLKNRVSFLSGDRVWFQCDELDCHEGDNEYQLSDGTWMVAMQWWSDYMDATIETLRESPCSEAIRRQTRPLEKALKEAMSCNCCREDAQSQMRMFIDDLCRHVDFAVEQVRLKLDL